MTSDDGTQRRNKLSRDKNANANAIEYKCDGRITRDAARYNRLLCRIYWDTKLGGETSMLYWVYEGNIYLQ